jgi:ribosome-binding protein aMBF1 (putative translation factor)
MSWFSRKKKVENLCQLCGEKQLPEYPATLRVNVQDGVAEMLVCDECANFFDKTSEVLNESKRKKSTDHGAAKEVD